MINKKGQIETALLIVVGLIIAIVIFGVFGAFKIATKLASLPIVFWYAILALIIFWIFKGK